jgi:lipid-A-disaccharide synthase-like uncharacterized protein
MVGAAIREPTHSQRWVYALVFGAIAGMAVGVLNLAAVANEWKLKEFFEVVDSPVTSFMERRNGYDYWLDSLVPEICYWTLIGILAALLFCVVKIVARDKASKYALLIGACGGMLVGGLDFLAVVNEWTQLERYFHAFDRPGIALVEPAWDHLYVSPQYLLPTVSPAVLRRRTLYRRKMMKYMFAGAVAYWSLIGLLIALLFCSLRNVWKRKGAAETRGSRECLSKA